MSLLRLLKKVTISSLVQKYLQNYKYTIMNIIIYLPRVPCSDTGARCRKLHGESHVRPACIK
jgi:hypothetical protein